MFTKLLFFALSVLFAAACVPTVTEVEKPNVVFILADDLGWADLGVMGSSYYETPHLDALTAEGMLFRQAYAGAANCAPSRACLLSGYNTPRHGIYTVGNSDRGDARTRQLVPTPNHETLADSIYTLAELFRDQGYATGMMGKWHLGDDPTTQGFQTNVGGSHRGNPGSEGYFSPYRIDFIEDGPAGEYLTDRLTDEAIAFVHDHQDTPFFLYLPFYTVHTPLMGKDSLVQKFAQKSDTPGQQNAEYAAMIASLDANVGRLLAELDKSGLRENTLVVFTSDNGGIRAISRQDPLRAGKGSYYEGGIRVPIIVRWPGHIAPGSQCNTPVTNLDFYSTLQRIIGSDNGILTGDGTDISPLFAGQTIPTRPLFWHFPVYLQAYDPLHDGGRDPLFRTRPGSVVRQGVWKLHEYFEDGALELYHLEEDPGETRNLALVQPEKAQELHRRLIQWRTDTHAPVPVTRNPAYDAGYEQQALNEIR